MQDILSNFCQALPEHRALHADVNDAPSSGMKRRKLNLTATFESSSSYFSFKRIAPGAFNTRFIGSTCIVLPVGIAPPLFHAADHAVVSLALSGDLNAALHFAMSALFTSPWMAPATSLQLLSLLSLL